MRLATRISLLTSLMSFTAIAGSLGAVAVALKRDVQRGLQDELTRAQLTLDTLLFQQGAVLGAGAASLANTATMQSLLTSDAVDAPTMQGVADEQRVALAAAKRLPMEQASMRRGAFNQSGDTRMLAESTCGIFGLGGTGLVLARLLKGLGARVHAINRRGESAVPVDWLGTPDALEAMLAACDVLFLTVRAFDAAPRQSSYNAIIQGCIACHSTSCGGPLDFIDGMKWQ